MKTGEKEEKNCHILKTLFFFFLTIYHSTLVHFEFVISIFILSYTPTPIPKIISAFICKMYSEKVGSGLGVKYSRF